MFLYFSWKICDNVILNIKKNSLFLTCYNLLSSWTHKRFDDHVCMQCILQLYVCNVWNKAIFSPKNFNVLSRCVKLYFFSIKKRGNVNYNTKQEEITIFILTARVKYAVPKDSTFRYPEFLVLFMSTLYLIFLLV